MAGFGASVSSLLQYGGRKQREKKIDKAIHIDCPQSGQISSLPLANISSFPPGKHIDIKTKRERQLFLYAIFTGVWPGGAAARLPAKRANIGFPKGTYRVCQRQTYRLKDWARTATFFYPSFCHGRTGCAFRHPGGAAARLPAKRANIEFPKGTYRVCQRQTYRLKDRARTVTLLHLFLLRALQAPFCMSVSGKRKKMDG